MATRSSILALLWLAVAALLTAQDQTSAPQDPTFRTGTQSVRVDLYVTKDGEPVRDLRRDEVQILEDGVPQTIQAFERITFALPRSGPAVEPKTPEHSRQLATNPRSRLFVLFLTAPLPESTANPRAPKPTPIVRMLNELFGPDDVVAVMTPYMRIEDLNFRRRLPQSDDAWFRDLKADPKQSLWDACYPPGMGSPINEMKARYRELMTFEALEALVTHLGGLRDERKHILMMSDGFRLYTRNPGLPSRGQPSGGMPIGGGGGGIGIAPRLGDGGGAAPGRVPSECQQDLKDLASLDQAGRLREITTYARRTNVSFYPISPQQLTAQVRSFRARGSFENTTPSDMQNSLRGLAEDTGGIPIVGTNNVQDILQRIMMTTSSYYLLGYTPANTTADGRFRRISVKVSRPDTDVHARSGYVAGLTEERPLAPADTRKAPDPIDISMKALTVSRTSVVHVRTSAWTRGGSSNSPAASLWIVGELDQQIRRQPSWSNGADAEVTLRPLSGGGAAIARQAKVTLADSTFEFELRESDGPIAPGDYSVQLQLTGADGNPVGEFARVTVPDAVSRLGEAVLLRRVATAGQRYIRTADPRFQRNDRLRLELPTDAADVASALLRDMRGAALTVPLRMSERQDDSGAFRWIVVDVPLTSLAPADYAVEVTQNGVSRLTAFRLAP
jgi:VWFA-related protein